MEAHCSNNFYMACPESFGIGYILYVKCLYEILELYLKTHEDINGYVFHVGK